MWKRKPNHFYFLRNVKKSANRREHISNDKFNIYEKSNSGDGDDSTWIFSYADLMSLLMCFFVILYATAEINPEKSREITSQLKYFFSDNKETVDHHVKMNEMQTLYLLLTFLNKEIKASESLEDPTETSSNEKEDQIDKVIEKLKEKLLERMEKEREKTFTYDFILPDTLFSSGSVTIKEQAVQKITEIANLVKNLPKVEELSITGHADSSPTRKSGKYPNNFSLSAARAGSVAQIFIESGIDKEIIRVSGMGSLQPLHPERDIRGRLLKLNQQKNRRIHIRLKAKEE